MNIDWKASLAYLLCILIFLAVGYLCCGIYSGNFDFNAWDIYAKKSWGVISFFGLAGIAVWIFIIILTQEKK